MPGSSESRQTTKHNTALRSACKVEKGIHAVRELGMGWAGVYIGWGGLLEKQVTLQMWMGWGGLLFPAGHPAGWDGVWWAAGKAASPAVGDGMGWPAGQAGRLADGDGMGKSKLPALSLTVQYQLYICIHIYIYS